jgi:hypothetical protein
MKKFFACRVKSRTAIDTILPFEHFSHIPFPVCKAILKNKIRRAGNHVLPPLLQLKMEKEIRDRERDRDSKEMEMER